jgi:alkylation response protein AidB-like acyl-CoA dehydrogenase
MVDCFTNAQEARSMTLMASLKIDDKDSIVRRKAASGAKVQIGKSGKFCGQSAVQMHGGMGVTDELSVSHYFKRLTMIDLMFGNQQHHLTRYSNLAMAA